MKPVAHRIALVLALVVGGRPMSAQEPPKPTLDAVLRAAGAYAVEFIKRFSNVVAQERYVQEAPGDATVPFAKLSVPGMIRSELVSDFLFVKVPGDDSWMPFRDVFEVNGVAVRDRQDRLTKLFLQPVGTAIDQATTIAAESTRYNLGGSVIRTLNLPVYTMLFVMPEHQGRSRFTHLREDRREGAGIWAFDFKEEMRPTFVHGINDENVPSEGRIWVELANGRVVRTEQRLARRGVLATITTMYRDNPAFGLNLPVEMRERYELARGRAITAVATYTNFRRFIVQTGEVIKK